MGCFIYHHDRNFQEILNLLVLCLYHCHIRHELKATLYEPGGSCDLRCKKTSPNRICYISSWPEFQGGPEYPIRNLEILPVAPATSHIRHKLKDSVTEVVTRVKKHLQIENVIYISSWPEFQGGSEYPVRNLKFLLVAPTIATSVFHATILGKYDLGQLGWSLYHHQDLIFKGMPQIWTQKFEILSWWHWLWSYWCFVPSPDVGQIWPTPIMMIYTSSRLNFQRGDSEFPIRILQFHQWHLLWPYQCLRQIAGKISPPPIRMIYISSLIGIHNLPQTVILINYSIIDPHDYICQPMPVKNSVLTSPLENLTIRSPPVISWPHLVANVALVVWFQSFNRDSIAVNILWCFYTCSISAHLCLLPQRTGGTVSVNTESKFCIIWRYFYAASYTVRCFRSCLWWRPGQQFVWNRLLISRHPV